MRGFAAWGAMLVVIGAPRVGGADTLEATYGPHNAGGGALTETAHRVHVTKRGRTARYRVVRTFRNSGTRVEEATLNFDMPSRAVSTRLRLRAGRRWIEGKLLPADKADQRYLELTTQGRPARRGPAILSWVDRSRLKLRVFPVPAKGTVTVSYDLVAPLCYRRGVFWADYPTDGIDGGASIRLRVARPGRVTTRRWLAANAGFEDATEPCAPPAPDKQRAFVAFDDRRRVGVSARYARHVLTAGGGVIGIDVDIAKRLAVLPRRAQVVFVVDASHSVGTGGIRAQLDLVSGYLAHIPDARARIVAYRRRATEVTKGWVPARTMRARIAARTFAITPGNGSHLDRGLARAAEIMKRARGVRRVVAFTDSVWRRSFSSAMATAALAPMPRDSVLHVAALSLSSGAWSMERYDDHELSSVARRYGGIAATLSGGPDHVVDAIPAVLGLVRPIQIDNLSIDGPLGKGLSTTIPDVLAEGDAYSIIDKADKVPKTITVRGDVWGRPWVRRLRPGAVASRVLPALVFGDELMSSLPNKWISPLARAGRVVSPETSFLAHDPKVRASSYGEEFGISSTCGCMAMRGRGFGHRGGIGGIGRAGRRGEPIEPLMRSLVWPAINACTLSAGRDVYDIRVDVETHTREILDVGVRGAPTQAIATCIQEEVWKVRLPKQFHSATRVFANRFRWPVR